MTPAELKAALMGGPDAIRPDLLAAVEAAAETMASEAKRQLASAAAPSQPGVGPADPSGALAASITVAATPDGAAVVAAAPAAIDLEYGTTRMAARPFLRPAVEATRDEVRAGLADAFRRAVAAAFGRLS